VVRIHSPRPNFLLHFKYIRRLEKSISNRCLAIVPSFVPTPDRYAACAVSAAMGADLAPDCALRERSAASLTVCTCGRT
jgi:hypothetical protein